MKIYVEIAIIDNLIVNFLLLELSSKIYKVFGNKKQVLLSSIIGTIFAIVFPLLDASKIVIFFLKILLGIVLSVVALKPKNFKDLFAKFLTFFALTFALGGLILAIYTCFGIEINSFCLFSSSAVFPLSIFVLFVFLFFKISTKLTKFLIGYVKLYRTKLRARITCENRKLELSAMFDSGNILQDKLSGLPICVISFSAFKKVFPSISLIDIILKKDVKVEGCHYVSYSTISNSKNTMLVFRPQNFEIFKNDRWVQKQVLLGISLAKFNENSDFDLLINGLCEV